MQAILDLLQTCTDQAFFSFRDALIEIGRKDLVDDNLPIPCLAAGKATPVLSGTSSGASSHIGSSAAVQENVQSDKGKPYY